MFFRDSPFLRLFLYFRSEIRMLNFCCAEARLRYIDCVEITSDRSSCLQMFFITGNLKNSAIFKRKHLCLGLFLIKLL